MFARIKMTADSILTELSLLLDAENQVRTIMDIGSGYGIPGTWCVERFKDATVYGIEPDPEKARIASMAVGERGRIIPGLAPDIPETPDTIDLALMLDMMHYLDDRDLKLTLTRLYDRLGHQGFLILRTVVPLKNNFSWLFWIEDMRLKLFKIPAYYRSTEEIRQQVEDAGFQEVIIMPSKTGKQLVWFKGEKKVESSVSKIP